MTPWTLTAAALALVSLALIAWAVASGHDPRTLLGLAPRPRGPWPPAVERHVSEALAHANSHSDDERGWAA